MNYFGLSLILKGGNYFKKFKKFSILNLERSLGNIYTKKKTFVFFISTERNLEKKIKYLFKKYFNKYNYKIVFDYDLEEYSSKDISYKIISKIQKKHLFIIKNNKFDYIVFLYSDIIYSKNTFYNSLKILNNKKDISAVCSFGIALNDCNTFQVFYKKLHNNKNYLEFFLKKANNLISNFHKQFFYGNNIIYNSNCIFFLKKNCFFIKSYHYHPILIKVNKIINSEFKTLDSDITKFFNNANEIYVEKEMKKICIFSFDSPKLSRNKILLNTNFIVNNKLLFKRLSLINFYINLGKGNFYLKNYIGFSLNKYIKIQSLNNFVNYFIKFKSKDLKNKLIENLYNFFIKQKIKNPYSIFIFLIKIFINSQVIFKRSILKNYLEKLLNVGIINKDIYSHYYILYIYAIFFNIINLRKKIKLLFRLLVYKKI